MSSSNSRKPALDANHPDPATSARFDACYADVAPALYAWAELRIRSSLRARLEPQDLVQEVWLRGFRSFAGFEERGASFRSWAFKIGKNVLMEAIRASRQELFSLPGSGATNKLLALDGVPQDVTSFTQRLAKEDSIREFLAHANQLEEVDRMLLIHCGLEDETCAEVAPKLGLSEDGAIKRWQRLKAKLREKPWSRALLGVDGPSTSGARGTLD